MIATLRPHLLLMSVVDFLNPMHEKWVQSSGTLESMAAGQLTL